MSHLTENELKKIPICNYLIQYKEDIKSEIFAYLDQSDSMIDHPKYFIEDETKKMIPLYENFWKVSPFSVLYGDVASDLNESEYEMSLILSERSKWNCPTLCTLTSGLESGGNLVNCFISKLLPGSKINSHRGWPLEFVRVYFCFSSDSECKIKINDKEMSFENLIGSSENDDETHSIIHRGSIEQIFLSMDLKTSYVKKYQ
jgi:hypothetical protein